MTTISLTDPNAWLPLTLLATFAVALAVNGHRGLGMLCGAITWGLAAYLVAPLITMTVVHQIQALYPPTLAAAGALTLVLLIGAVALESTHRTDPLPA